MDNPQATHSFQLGYIAGIIDGEGTIGIHISDKYGNYKPVLKIFNTDLRLIEYVSSFMKLHDMPHYVYISNPKRAKTRYRPCYAIVVMGYKRMNKVLNKIIPIVYAKRKQAEFLMEIIKSRLSVPMNYQNQMRKFTLYELNLVKKIKKLNQRGRGMRVLND